MHQSLITRVAAGVAAGVVFAALSAAPAAAQRPRTGSVLTFSGTASAFDVGAPGVELTFDPATAVAGTGSFAALGGQPFAVQSFVVGSGGQLVSRLFTVGGYTFNLAGLPSGRFGHELCYPDQGESDVGQTCSPLQAPGTAVSPFELTNVPSTAGDPSAPLDAAIGFNFYGTVTGPRGNAVSTFSGYLASLVPGTPYQYVLAGLEQTSAQGGALGPLPYVAMITVTGSLSGQIVDPGDLDADADVTVNPEPSTVAFAAAGLAALAGAARARRRRA